MSFSEKKKLMVHNLIQLDKIFNCLHTMDCPAVAYYFQKLPFGCLLDLKIKEMYNICIILSLSILVSFSSHEL